MGIERTAIIGDIHGTFTEMQELLQLLDYKSPHVRIILLGDLEDRGPQSLECVQLARELNLESVMGNHDHKVLKWWKNHGSRGDIYAKQPHYTQFTEEDIDYIAQMKPYIEIPEYNTVIVHAGLRAGLSLDKQSKDDLYYIRYVESDGKFVSLRKINAVGSKEAAGAHFWTEFGPFGFNIVYGHQVWEEPRIDTYPDGTQAIGIDTGCVFGNKLCAYILETKEFIQVKAKRIYYQSSFNIR
jgi:predicted phosphodiesterase